jgi:hypothetical protein
LCSTVARSYGSRVIAVNLAACVRERERETFGETEMWIFVHSVDITAVLLATWVTVRESTAVVQQTVGC